MELTFLPDGGWEAAVAAAAAARTAAALPPRWVISWSVGPGATVDRGLKLAKLHCVGVDKYGGPGNTKEHFIVGECMESCLSRLAVLYRPPVCTGRFVLLACLATHQSRA